MAPYGTWAQLVEIFCNSPVIFQLIDVAPRWVFWTLKGNRIWKIYVGVRTNKFSRCNYMNSIREILQWSLVQRYVLIFLQNFCLIKWWRFERPNLFRWIRWWVFGRPDSARWRCSLGLKYFAPDICWLIRLYFQLTWGLWLQVLWETLSMILVYGCRSLFVFVSFLSDVLIRISSFVVLVRKIIFAFNWLICNVKWHFLKVCGH